MNRSRKQTRRRESGRRSGFVMVVTVVLIFIIGMTLAALGFTSYMQMMRTQTLAQEAQLRQLLLAGTQIAQARLQSPATLEAPLPLPDALAADGAKLAIHGQVDATADKQAVQIEAAVGNRHLSQTVQFAMRDGAWRVTSAELTE